MNWLAKISAFRVLSALPGGSSLYRLVQEKFTHSLVPIPARVHQKIAVGLRYFDWMQQNNCVEQLRNGTHLDFGTGWQPTVPFLFHSFGVDRQLLFDIVPVLTSDVVAATAKTFCEIADAPDCIFRHQLRRLPQINGDAETNLSDLLQQLGLQYFAPYQPKLDQLEGAIDVISSTQVLLHIDKNILRQIFRDLHRALKKGGKFFATIHLKDLFANDDRNITHYNHLRYSERTWKRWINSPLMSYNRLKAPDYRELLTEAGFIIRHFEIEPPTASDLQVLNSIKIDPFFSNYSREDLGAKHLFFVAEKP